MSSLPSIKPSKAITITLEPLDPSTFAPFGTVITTPLPETLNKIPPSIPIEYLRKTTAQIQFANQHTAIKTSPVSPLINNYFDTDLNSNNNNNNDDDDKTPTKSNKLNTTESKSRGQFSIFSCFPRTNLHRKGNEIKLRVEILERHPFTTQTFCPFGASTSNDETAGGRTFWIVVVARTAASSSADGIVKNPPDLSSIRAFIAPIPADRGGVGGGIAVTYAPGTWHAPMVVVGERRVDFLVSQFVNGVPEDDCQEVLIGGDAVGVNVDLSGLGLEDGHLWRRKKRDGDSATGKRVVKL